ncbi:MAG TPA: site-2 protease family protein, partial [Methylotenera sp.]|nr:site-2 protease family protein [Methylotenera sp.]
AAVKIDQQELDKLLVEINYSPLMSLQKAVSKTWDTSVFSLKMLGKMLLGQVSLKSISGPVTIADYAGKSANMGMKTFLSFLALVSISIGVLNLLPIPVLDGGHLMYYTVEIFKGSPVSENIMLAGQKIGFAILGLLMTLAIFNDFNRLLT